MKENRSEIKYKNQGMKYLRDGKKLLDKKDFAQSSEKLWGATASFVKAVAERKKLSHNGHARLFKVVDTLAKKTSDGELRRLFRLANSLHINFYENWLTPGDVIEGKEDVENLIEKLKNILDDKNKTKTQVRGKIKRNSGLQT